MKAPVAGHSATEFFDAAVAHFRENRLGEAERCCREQLAEHHTNGPCLDLLGTIRRLKSDLPGALDYALAAVRVDPAISLFEFNLGECYRALGQQDEAIGAYQRSLALAPAPQTYRAMGAALEAMGKLDDAIAVYERSVELEPKSPLAHVRLLRCLHRAGQFQRCIDAGASAVVAGPREPEIHFLIGLSQLRLRRFLEAAETLRTSARLKRTTVCLASLATALNGLLLCPQAAAAARDALALDGDDVESHKQMGIALHWLGELSKAAEHLNRALKSHPRDIDCLVKLATLELARLRQGDAMRLLHDARNLSSHAPHIASARLMTMNYAASEHEAEIFAEHVKFGEQLAQNTVASKLTGYTRKNRSRRLRVGYVSPDLREHAVACFAEALLVPVKDVEEDVVVFSDTPRPDAVTRRLQSHGVAWHDTHTLNHTALAELIEREAIDILVDLAGHTADNRLPMFALRPAPVQMTYLGYPNTTGLPRSIMQYRITDAICDPVGASDAMHAEQLLRLPGIFLCYTPPADAPAVSEPPSVQNGYITFGCFSNMAKLSWELLGEWAELLRGMSDSRLLLKNHSLADEPLCESIRQFFAGRDIAPSRIELRRGNPRFTDHLASYREMDIALDTYPYNGTTTICEALWMGVPVMTMSGQSHRSRVGRSILTAVGLPELATDNVESFRSAALELAGDPRRIRTLRSTLRSRVRDGTLTDRHLFRRRLHTWGYRSCNRRSVGSLTGGLVSPQ